MNQPAPPPAPPKPPDPYLIFCGAIDGMSAQKIANAMSIASQQKPHGVHLVLQTSGGSVADGVFLYNLFKSSPIDVTVYNIGSVASIGVIAFLGAKHRKASAHSTFMTHRTTGPILPATASQLKAITKSVDLDDARTEAILKANLKLPDEVWANLWRHDLHWSAADAVTIGLAHSVEEFAPIAGAAIYSL